MGTRDQLQKKSGVAVAPHFAPSPVRTLQRKCACGGSGASGGECGECKKKKNPLQRSATPGAVPGEAPPIVHEVLRSTGQPLDASTRAYMEPRFGHDFSNVRVHTDAQAADSALAVSAIAYTVGHQIAFGRGHYAPGTEEGRRLLAHELTHVVQQVEGPASGPLTIREASDPAEHAAQSAAHQLSGHHSALPNRVAQSIQLQRDAGPSFPGHVDLSGVAAEKYSPELETAYRRQGQNYRASAIRQCRTQGGAWCNRILTEEEARAAFQLANEGQSARDAASKTSARQPSVQKLARVPLGGAVAIPVAAGTGSATGATGVGAFVLEALPPVALVAVAALFLAALTEEVRFSRFVSILEDNGFVVLLNPLGACIGACHAAAATTSLMEPVTPLVPEPLGPRFPPFEPEPRPAPEPEARLEPEPRPEERMDPFSPRVPDEEEPRRRRCTVEEVDPRFGRSPCHSDFAMTFSGTRREFRVTEPGGIATVFDAKQGPILYEVKTGYGWVLNQNLGPEMEQRRNEVINRFQEQAAVQLFIATRCGYELDWYFNSRSVAEFFDPLIAPMPVRWRPYNCDTDSDHTW